MKEIYESGKPVRAEQERAELERREYLAGFALACYEQEQGAEWDAGDVAEALVEAQGRFQLGGSWFREGRLAGVRAAMGL